MDTGLIISLIAIFLLVLGAAFCAGSETALTAISRARIYHLVMEGNRRARIVSKLRREKEALIGTLLLGNTAVNIAASAIATTVALQLWGDRGVAIVTVVMTLIVLIFGEVMPKTFAIQNAERFSLAVAPMVLFLIRLFSPVTRVVQGLIRFILKLFRIDITGNTSFISASDSIRGTIELHHREGDVVKQERDMLGSILDLSEIAVSDVMVHRKHVEMINADQPAEEIVRLAIMSSHSRLPLWRDKPENIIGLLHVKNLVRAINGNSGRIDNDMILRICARPWFIPDSTTLRDQLLAFRQKRQHFAHVVDEYGALLGIITLEDIIEEIVGDIDDEHDRHRATGIRKLSDTVFVVNGTVPIRDFNREFDWNLPDEHASTIAGLVIHEAQLIPEQGAVFEFYGCHFTIEEKRGNQLTRIRIEKLDKAPPEERV